jgi:hypothetical protein
MEPPTAAARIIEDLGRARQPEPTSLSMGVAQPGNLTANPSPYPIGVTDASGSAGSEPVPGRLRVVVVVDGRTVPAAVARTIDRVANVQVHLVGIRIQSPPVQRSLGVRLTALVDRFDRACFRPSPDAFQPVDLGHAHADLLANAQTAWNLDGQPLDLVLDLTCTGVQPRIDEEARLGIWSLRYGEDSLPLGPAAFVREFKRGSAASTTALVAREGLRTHASGPAFAGSGVIYRSVGDVDPYSPARTRNAAAWKAAEFPARVLTDITAGRSPNLYEAPLPRSSRDRPSARSAVGLVIRMSGRSLREAVRRLVQRPGWFVALRVAGPALAATGPNDMSGFRALDAPPGRFYADPFIVRSPAGAHLFMEDGPIGGGPARIVALDLDSSGRLKSSPMVALEAKTHLSYPFIFQDEGEWYMLPESADTQTVELFKARRFPDEWERCAVLLKNIRAWDPTLLRHLGRYWLFATVAAFGASESDELCLFWSESLLGPWRAHARNPVVSDARHARPAGRILVDDGSLVRPAQDCTGGYGRRIVLNRIDVMTEDDYRETSIGSIDPHWQPGVIRTHTYAVNDDLEALDGLRYERRVRFLPRRQPALG